MKQNAIRIAEARRRLPELVRKVAEGHPPIAIGRRGRAEVVIALASSVAVVSRRPLRGLVQVLESEQALEDASAAIRADIDAALEQGALFVREPEAPAYRPRPKKRKRS